MSDEVRISANIGFCSKCQLPMLIGIDPGADDDNVLRFDMHEGHPRVIRHRSDCENLCTSDDTWGKIVPNDD